MKQSWTVTVTPVLTALVVLSLLFGCTYVSVETRKYLAVPSYPPTNPTAVQILRSEPTTQHERIGEISLEPQGNPSIQEMEAKLVGTPGVACLRQGHRGCRNQVHSVDSPIPLLKAGPYIDHRKMQLVVFGCRLDQFTNRRLNPMAAVGITGFVHDLQRCRRRIVREKKL